MTSEAKVGIFALIALIIIGLVTLKVGSRSFVFSRGYEVKVVIDNAIGIRTKTPVEIAGIKIGQVKSIELLDSMKAELTLTIDSDVVLPGDTVARVRSKGFLGEILIELLPGTDRDHPVKDEQQLAFAGQGGDINTLLVKFSGIADDIKAVSSSLKDMAGGDKNSPVWNIVNNLEKFTQTLANNQANFNKVSDNLAELTDSLRGTIVKSRENVEESIQRIASITKKVDEGKGTVGKLINDDTTVTKLNEAVDSLNQTLGGLKQLETQIGYHGEYLTGTNDFKQYVSLALKPRPDKAFLFDFVADPDPSPNREQKTSTISTGGTSTTVTTNTATIPKNSFRFSAQLAKRFYDFTIRGGIIESRGGLGADYDKGPVGAHFSAFDFQGSDNIRPHLKAYGTVNLTTNIFVMGGADDFINKQQSIDWFVGAGFRLTDDDVKSLLGMGAGLVKVK